MGDEETKQIISCTVATMIFIYHQIVIRLYLVCLSRYFYFLPTSRKHVAITWCHPSARLPGSGCGCFHRGMLVILALFSHRRSCLSPFAAEDAAR